MRRWFLRAKVSRPGDNRLRPWSGQDRIPPTHLPLPCALALARGFPDRIFARVLCQTLRSPQRRLRLLSLADLPLVFGFEFMNYKLISVGILNNRHVTTR